jgi:hypothetical protein
VARHPTHDEPVVCEGCGQFSPLAFALLLAVFIVEFVLLPWWRALP